MSVWVSLPQNSDLLEGQRYRITFDVKNKDAFQIAPTIDTPTDFDVPIDNSIRLRIYHLTKDEVANKIIVEGEFVKKDQYNQYAPFGVTPKTPQLAPVVLIIGGLIAVLGLTIFYLSVQKVEKLVDNPLIDTALVIGMVLLVFGVIWGVRKYFS